MTIKAGDLVMIVRWPHRHTSNEICSGMPFVVQDISPCEAECGVCRESYPGPSAVIKAGGHKLHPLGVPVSWLKRIDPLTEPETIERDEERTA